MSRRKRARHPLAQQTLELYEEVVARYGEAEGRRFVERLKAAVEQTRAGRCTLHVPCDGIDLCEHCRVRKARLEREAGQ